MDIPHFIYQLSCSWVLGCFKCLAIGNKVVVNTNEQIFYTYSKGMLNLENPKELSKVVVPFFFPQKFIPILVFLHFCQFLILSVFLLKCQITPILTILTSLKLHCNFNFIFLMINDVEYLFMSFLTICIIYHMKC